MPADKESGVLRTTAQTSSRPLAALLLCGAVLVVPLLLIKSGADAAPSEGSGSRSHHPSADAAPGPVPSAAEAPATGAGGSVASPPSTPPPTAPPATAQLASTGPSQAEATLTAQNVAHHAPLVEVAPTTTTSVPPPTTTTTTTTTPTTFRPLPPPVAGSTHYGQVTYYDHPAGRCASPYLAFGTVVRITNPANGESVSCVVDDREADTARSIDLATASFALIAPLGQGVIDAELSW
jgi:rare lipoprotein A